VKVTKKTKKNAQIFKPIFLILILFFRFFSFFLSLSLIFFCTYHSLEIDCETTKKKKKRNRAMIRIYIFVFTYLEVYLLLRLCTLFVFLPVIKKKKTHIIKKKHTNSIPIYVSLRFLIRFSFFFFFILFVLFISIYLLRSIIKTKLQICILFECFVFHRLKQTYK
jgi:hypothetical protein